jgi:hypothetical protein
MEIDKIFYLLHNTQNGVNCDGLDHNITKSTLDNYVFVLSRFGRSTISLDGPR